MANVYDSMSQYAKGTLSRRAFLKRAVAASVATPAMLALLQACAPAPGAAPAAPAAQSVDLSTFSQADAQTRPLVFNAWSFLPEVVAQFQADFQDQYNEAVDFEVIPGDYTTIMINKFVANSPLDALYTKAQGTKMLEAGWIHDLSDLENIEEIKAATLPAQWEAQTYKGKVFGLPYFNSMKCVLLYNRARTEEAGISEADLPKTWDEAYDIARRLKQEGFAQYPIVPWWLPNADYLLDNFIAETLARGDMMWDKEFNAVFDESTAIAATLEAWAGLWRDELVPPDVLSSADLNELFATGDAVFKISQSYHLKDLNDPKYPALAGNVMMVPYVEQPWGFLDYGLYSIASRPAEDVQTLERRKRWVNFMGYKDINDTFHVAKQWVIQANLGSGYPEVYEDPDVIAAYESWMPEYPKLRDIMAENEKAVQIANGWHAVWYPEWSVKAVEILPKVIIGDMPVTEGVQALRAEWDSLQATYAE